MSRGTAVIRLLLAALLALPSLSFAAGPEAAVDAFHAALAAGKGEAALELLHPAAVVFEEGYVERGRDEYARLHLQADLEFAAAVRREVTQREVKVQGDTAWVLSQFRAGGEFRGKPVRRIGVETMLLQREKDVWRIVHIHWSGHAEAGGSAH